MDHQSHQRPVSSQWVGEDYYQGLSPTITTYQPHTSTAYEYQISDIYQTFNHDQSWYSNSTDDSSPMSPSDYPQISCSSPTSYPEKSNFSNYPHYALTHYPCKNDKVFFTSSCDSPTTPSHPPPLSTTQSRRLSANARERKRMSKINSGYDRLRRVLPVGKNCQLSKMEALQMAQSYIRTLQVMLSELG